MTPAEELARNLGARASELDGAKIVPMLCEREEASARVLAQKGWLYELKLDGVRILADKRGPKTRLYYRKLREATESYGEIAAAVAALPDERLVLDGELVAFDEEGRPDFQRLGHRIQAHSKRSLRSPIVVPVVYVVFDVLAVGAYDVRGFPLEARKEILKRIVSARDEGAGGGLLRLHPTFGDGVELFRLCREHRLEGVVGKKLGTSYRAGERTTDWLKIKCERDAEFVVVGWTEGERDRARLGALDLGAYEGDRLVFRGRVGSGLHAAIIDTLLERLVPMEVPQPVAEGKYSPKPKRHHCRPEIVVSVRYGGWSLDPSGARFLRFPVFRGMRPDVDPTDCTAAPDDRAEIARVRVDESETPRRLHVTAPSHAVLRDLSKSVLCTYFEAITPSLLRHTSGRTCVLSRQDGTILWPPPKWTPKFVRTTTSKGFVVDSVDALLFAVEAMSPCIQHGTSLEDRPDVVDFLALRVTAEARAVAVAGARHVRELATELGLDAAPIAIGEASFDVVVGVGSAAASSATHLAMLLARLAEEAGSGASIASVDTIRTPFAPGPDAIVAVPLAWDEIDDVDPAGIGLEEALERAGAADPAMAVLARTTPLDVARATRDVERIVGVLGSRRAPR